MSDDVTTVTSVTTHNECTDKPDYVKLGVDGHSPSVIAPPIATVVTPNVTTTGLPRAPVTADEILAAVRNGLPLSIAERAARDLPDAAKALALIRDRRSESDRLRALLAEALDGWEHAVTYGSDGWHERTRIRREAGLT